MNLLTLLSTPHRGQGARRAAPRALRIALLCAALGVPLAVGPAFAQAPAPLKAHLSEENASGIFAEVTLTPMGQQTRVVITATGAGAGPQPAHIHNGSCLNLDPKPLFPLSNVVNGASETVVDAPLSQLQATPMAINLHKSPAEASVYVSCGNIPLARAVAVGGASQATPSRAPAAAPARPAAPTQLPRTGGIDLSVVGAIGGLLTLVGRRIARRAR